MGDSDDDYKSNISNNGGGGSSLGHHHMANNNNSASNLDSNKKNRDKFYREREDNTSSASNPNNNRRSGPTGGGEWNDSRSRNSEWKNSSARNSYSGGSYSSAYRSSSSRYSSNTSPHHHHHSSYETSNNNTRASNSASPPPPNKRAKKDWSQISDEPSSSHQHLNNTYHGRTASSNPSYSRTGIISMLDNQQMDPDYPTQPPLLSFKQFLQRQDDGISDEEAIKHYADYKIEFKKTQINNYFLEHKEQDWFKLKYHPDECHKKKLEHNKCVLSRLDVFMELMSKGWLNELDVEYDKTKELVKLMDAFVIKLEGGTDEDLDKLLNPSGSDQAKHGMEQGTKEGENDDDVKEIKSDVKKSKKQQRSKSDKYSSHSEKSSSSEEEDAAAENDSESDSSAASSNSSNKKKKSRKSHAKKDGKKLKKSESKSDSESGAYTDSETEKTTTKENVTAEKPKVVISSPPSLPQLHRTSSIFMRNLAPSVTRADLETLCRNYDGFKRVALSDPTAERGFFRRGWITFESNVDVKKICWSLQNIKIKDFNPGAIVNRELTNRIRPITNLVSHHKSVIRNDIKLAMKIIQNMDKRWNLWQEEALEVAGKQNGSTYGEQETHSKNGVEREHETKNIDESTIKTSAELTNSQNATNNTDGQTKTDQSSTSESTSNADTNAATAAATAAAIDLSNLEEQAFSPLPNNQTPLFLQHKYVGTNPLLINITDYLVDETNAEEEELLSSNKKQSSLSSSNPTQFDIDLDKQYAQALDKLIIYLRLVHSIDFYNASEYHQEDSMPNRCGIIFVRPSLPSNAAPCSLKITQQECDQYMQGFESKLKPFLDYKEKIEADMAKKLGSKVRQDEIEKFIKTNTQELGPDRWLCPLSGKRFKGAEFIRKHLFYKHMEKITDVKKEVEYFNNYVFDPKRPQLPEHPSNKSGGGSSSSAASVVGSISNAPSSSFNQTSKSHNGNGNFNHSQHSSYSNQYLSGQAGQGYGGGGMMMGGGGGMNQYSNRYAGGWQGSGGAVNNFNNPMDNQNMMPGYGAPSMGGYYNNNQAGYGMGGGFNQGFKKPGYGGMGGGMGMGTGYSGASGPRRGNPRELIQYKDLDAPDA